MTGWTAWMEWTTAWMQMPMRRKRAGAGRIAPMLVIAALVGAGVGVVVWKRKKKKIAEEKALEDELEEELDNELGEPEMTTADVSEDETKDVEKEQNDHLKRKKK